MCSKLQFENQNQTRTYDKRKCTILCRWNQTTSIARRTMWHLHIPGRGPGEGSGSRPHQPTTPAGVAIRRPGDGAAAAEDVAPASNGGGGGLGGFGFPGGPASSVRKRRRLVPPRSMTTHRLIRGPKNKGQGPLKKIAEIICQNELASRSFLFLRTTGEKMFSGCRQSEMASKMEGGVVNVLAPQNMCR